jgi:hypothetical protein
VRRYTEPVAEFLKVRKEDFEAVIKALLATRPTSAKTIEGKRPRRADAQKPGPKKARL